MGGGDWEALPHPQESVVVVDALAGAGGGGPQETQNWNACWEMCRAFPWAGVGVQLGGYELPPSLPLPVHPWIGAGHRVCPAPALLGVHTPGTSDLPHPGMRRGPRVCLPPPPDRQFAGAAEGPLPVSRSRRGLLTFARAWARLFAARSWTAKYTAQRGHSRGRSGQAGFIDHTARLGRRRGSSSRGRRGGVAAREAHSCPRARRGPARGIRCGYGGGARSVSPKGLERIGQHRGEGAGRPPLCPRVGRGPRAQTSRDALARGGPTFPAPLHPPAYLAGSAALGERGPGRHSRAGGLRGARTGRPAVKLRRGASHGSQSPGKRRRRASRAAAPGAKASQAGVPAAARSARRHT